MMSTFNMGRNKKIINAILLAGILVGTMDIAAAVIQYLIGGGKDPWIIPVFISSGILGSDAFAMPRSVGMIGLFCHYLIAWIFSGFFILIYPRIQVMSFNHWLTGILYGIFIWMVMNLVIVPLSKAPQSPLQLKGVLISMAILVFMIGIPLSFIAKRLYHGKK